MEITLLRTGGIIPIIKRSSAEVDWSASELDLLINTIRTNDTPGKMRDGTQYQLVVNKETITIDLEKVPAKYKKIFEKLKGELKISKR